METKHTNGLYTLVISDHINDRSWTDLTLFQCETIAQNTREARKSLDTNEEAAILLLYRNEDRNRVSCLASTVVTGREKHGTLFLLSLLA